MLQVTPIKNLTQASYISKPVCDILLQARLTLPEGIRLSKVMNGSIIVPATKESSTAAQEWVVTAAMDLALQACANQRRATMSKDQEACWRPFDSQGPRKNKHKGAGEALADIVNSRHAPLFMLRCP